MNNLMYRSQAISRSCNNYVKLLFKWHCLYIYVYIQLNNEINCLSYGYWLLLSKSNSERSYLLKSKYCIYYIGNILYLLKSKYCIYYIVYILYFIKSKYYIYYILNGRTYISKVQRKGCKSNFFWFLVKKRHSKWFFTFFPMV